jgi:chemotaxis regulatin CheY-phosphate phosphatase CheZ
MPYQREAEAVLAMWRVIERTLAKVDPGSVEAERLQTDAALLRDEYQRLMREAIANDRPVPPAFPEPSDAG